MHPTAVSTLKLCIVLSFVLSVAALAAKSKGGPRFALVNTGSDAQQHFTGSTLGGVVESL